MSSNTFTLTGNSSRLSCNIFPEVVLDEKYDYSCALLEFTAYHSIPNITEANNRVQFYWESDRKPAEGPKDGQLTHFDIPPGSYEAHEILDFIKNYFKKHSHSFDYIVNKNTFKTTIECSTALYTGAKNSNNILRHIFGFKEEKLFELNTRTTSNDIIKIANQDVVRVGCNIVSGSYVNGERSHSIYEFATNKVEVGYKIIERPRNLIYLPITTQRLNYIEISLVDQNGAPIDFRGETVTCRIHIKKE